jgi:hypothetical protein
MLQLILTTQRRHRRECPREGRYGTSLETLVECGEDISHRWAPGRILASDPGSASRLTVMGCPCANITSFPSELLGEPTPSNRFATPSPTMSWPARSLHTQRAIVRLHGCAPRGASVCGLTSAATISACVLDSGALGG